MCVLLYFNRQMIDQARTNFEIEGMIQTGLVTTDACIDFIFPAFNGF